MPPLWENNWLGRGGGHSERRLLAEQDRGVGWGEHRGGAIEQSRTYARERGGEAPETLEEGDS